MEVAAMIENSPQVNVSIHILSAGHALFRSGGGLCIEENLEPEAKPGYSAPLTTNMEHCEVPYDGDELGIPLTTC